MRTLKPLLVKLHGSDGYQPVVGSMGDTAGIKSGSVVLKPGECVGEHVTTAKEEVIIILKGKSEIACGAYKPFTANKNSVIYIPPETKHNVKNTGRGLLHYVYVVAKI